MGLIPDKAQLPGTGLKVLVALCVLVLVPIPAVSREAAEATRTDRALTLMQESLQWIRRQGRPVTDTAEAAPSGAPVSVPSAAGMPADAIPLSSAPAREDWIGERFYLRGEDNEAEHSDRVRLGFETSRVPGFSNNLTVDGNWSMSQQPGDTTMDIGLAWQLPLGKNQLTVRGRHHEYEYELDSGDVRQLGGSRQTLEMDLVRSLYDGPLAGLDASVVTTDVSDQWFENGDQTGEASRSYSLVRLHGHLGGHLPWLMARGDMTLAVEGCVALKDGAGQEACGEQLGAFQRYNLTGDLHREWLELDWSVRGEYQFTPDELPSWRYLEVGPGMMHGFGGQALRGRQGGWVRIDSETPSRPLWRPSGVQTSLRLSLLRGWTDSPGQPRLKQRASVGEVLWRVSGERLSGGLRAGALLDSSGPGMLSADQPDLSLDIAWTL